MRIRIALVLLAVSSALTALAADKAMVGFLHREAEVPPGSSIRLSELPGPATH